MLGTVSRDAAIAQSGKFIAKVFPEGYTKRTYPYHELSFQEIKAQGSHVSGSEIKHLEDCVMTTG